jgi:hypothetical protein
MEISHKYGSPYQKAPDIRIAELNNVSGNNQHVQDQAKFPVYPIVERKKAGCGDIGWSL